MVTDKNDTSKIDPANLFISVDYIVGLDKAATTNATQLESSPMTGRTLMMSLDCKSCHKENEKSIGPSFMQVSQKYAKNQSAMDYLVQKVVKGGGGVWGETAMAAHPNLPESDIRTIVQWVLSLSNQGNIKKSLPQKGTITPPANTKPGAALVMSASYTDKGGNNIKALTGRSTAVLNSNSISFKGTEKTNGFTSFNYNSMNVMVLPKTEGWFAVDSIDLTGVNSVTMTAGWQTPPKYGFDFEIRLDTPNGKVLGAGSLTPPADKKQQFGMVPIKIQPVTDGQYHTIYVTSKPKDPREVVAGGITTLQFK